jgi:predicted phosphohydrolase
MTLGKVLVSYFPQKVKFFGQTIIPSSMAELEEYCAPLDMHWFDDMPFDEMVLETAFDYWNFESADQNNLMPQSLIEKANDLNCLTVANAGAVFSVTDSKSTRWWYCAGKGWSGILMS